jgi:rfaE bifunctional protein kinase chain/domain
MVFSSTALIEQMPWGREAESHRLPLMCRRHGIGAESVGHTLERFRNLHVVVVGDVVLDRYILCDAHDVARESPMLSLVHRDERRYVGGAAIVARHVAALGGHAFLLSAGAEDEQTAHVTETLDHEGVEHHLIPARPALVEKTRFLAGDAKLFKLDRGHRLPLDSVAERRAAVILEQQSKLADAVIFCDFGFGMITGALLGRVLPSVRHNAGIVSADVSSGRNSLVDFRNVDLLCPTEREARATLNDADSGLSSIAWALLARTNARHLFITLEKRGLVVFDRRSQDRASPEWSARLRSEQVPAMAEHAVDLLGCGDALLAAATMSLAAGADLMHAAYLGSAAAAIEAATAGNHPVDHGGLREWLQPRRELRTDASRQDAEAVSV